MEERIDKALFDSIVAVGVREEGTVRDLDTLIIDREKAVQAILTAVAESLPPAKSDKGVFKLDYEVVAEIYGWNAYRNEVLAQLGKEER